MSRNESPDIAETARYLLFRLDEFERDGLSGYGEREWIAHVAPAIAKFRTAIAKARICKAKAITTKTDRDLDAPVWGARGIGAVLGLPETAVWHLLERGHLPATKIGGRWASTRRQLLGQISGAP